MFDDVDEQGMPAKRLGKDESDTRESRGESIAGGRKILDGMNAWGQEERQQDHIRRAGRHAPGASFLDSRLRQFEEAGLNGRIFTASLDLAREVLQVGIRLRPAAAVSNEEKGGAVNIRGLCHGTTPGALRPARTRSTTAASSRMLKGFGR